jgi:hypothetical protein
MRQNNVFLRTMTRARKSRSAKPKTTANTSYG